MAMYRHFIRQTKSVSRVMAESIMILQASDPGDDVDKKAPRA